MTSSSRRILLLIDNLGSGGAQRQMVLLAKMLKTAECEVSLVCYSDGNFFLPTLKNEGISIHWIVESNYLKRILKIRKFIRQGQYDAVISFLDVPNFLNNISAIGGKKWKVITAERSAKEDFFQSRKGRLFAWLQRYSDHIVCNSQNAKNMWLKRYPQYAYKLTTIYNAVKTEGVYSKYEILRDGKLHVIVAASYQYLKNPIGVIEALALMSENEKMRIDINWYGCIEVIKGDTRAYDEAVDLINKYSLEGIMHLHEETKDITSKMNEADIIALFSKVEGLPNAICEGMMLGKPVIMTRVSDYSDLVESSNGFLCNWDDPESIKTALVSFIGLGKKELIEMGKNSREKAKNLFNLKKVLNQWNNLIY